MKAPKLEKCEQILQIIKENSPMNINELRQKIWEQGIYHDSYSIHKVLNHLKRAKKIKWKVWIIRAIE